MIIDYTYFRGDILVAQKAQPEVLEDLNRSIAKYEPVYLKLLLGLGFYTDFMAGIEPVSGAEQRWMNLLEGVPVFTFNSKDYEWIGFKNDAKESPIANFVYNQYITKEVQQTTGIGQVKPSVENGVVVSAVPKLVRAWNEMIDWQSGLIKYLDANRSIYPEWKPYSNNFWFYTDWYYNHCNSWPYIFHKRNTLGI